MRGLVVVLTADASDARLLGMWVALRPPGGVGCAGPVPALVRLVLRRSPWRHALVADGECDPPQRELAQAAEGGCSKRRAVVGASSLRQAVFMEEAREDRPGLDLLSGEPCCTASEKAARGSGHRQEGEP
jgi:hypothetical protein